MVFEVMGIHQMVFRVMGMHQMNQLNEYTR